MGTYKKINGQAVPVTTEGHPQYYFQTKAQAEAALPTLEVGADVFVEEGGNEDVLPRVQELEEDVSEINSNLSKNDASLRQDGTIVNQITPAIGTSVGLYYNYYYKVGRKVTFNIVVQNVPSYGIACTLPVGYRPYSSVYAGGVEGSVSINSDGEVQIPAGNTYCSIEFDAFN